MLWIFIKKKSGGDILFFDPNQGIRTLKDSWELNGEIHSIRQDINLKKK